MQWKALESAGCELIFANKASSKKAGHPGLKKVLRMLSRGDTLVVWKLERLGRSIRHLVVLVEDWKVSSYHSYPITIRSNEEDSENGRKHLTIWYMIFLHEERNSFCRKWSQLPLWWRVVNSYSIFYNPQKTIQGILYKSQGNIWILIFLKSVS